MNLSRLTVISSCAANSPGLPSVDSVTSATANVLFATVTCGRRHSYGYVTSAHLATIRTSVLSVVVR